MAVNIYGGLTGHGKSYQVVTVMVEKYAFGRNIATNIEGLNLENIKAYAMQKYNRQESDLGTITVVNSDDIDKAGFFPVAELDGNGKVISSKNGVVKMGDLVIIDEAWKHWNSSIKISLEHQTFFRKMRHYVNPETKQTCDLIAITQDYTALNKDIKNLIETLFITRKLKVLGNLGENKYTLTVYEGNKTTRQNQIQHQVRKFDPEVFPLYKSYAVEGAKEDVIDKRTSVFSGAKFRLSMIFGVICLLITCYMVYYYYDMYSTYKKETKEKEDKAVKKAEGKPTISSNTSTGVPSLLSVPNKKAPVSKTITGALISDNRFIIFVKDNDRTIIVNNPSCNGSGKFMICDVDGEKIGYF